MEEKKPVKEYWVQLICHENDEYVELWKTKKGSYLARQTYSREGVWYIVSDPMGYCELKSPIAEQAIFHVCDKRWNELFISSNGDGKDFPCLRIRCQEEWERCRKSLANWQGGESSELENQTALATSSASVQNWLTSYKDSKVYGEIVEDYDENWAGLFETLEKTELSSFKYVGDTYLITKEQRRHKICGAEWVCYFVGGQYVGAAFDASNHGPMYAANIAEDMVQDALKEIYGSVSRLSCIVVREGEYSERCMTLYYAATHGLLQGDYRREVVDKIIENERRHHTFFSSRRTMQAQFPNYQPDYPTLM